MKPLVTVVIDNYNYANFLCDAIESVLQQTYKNLEIVVVDDGSTDNSRSIIKSMGNRVTPIYLKNGGQSAAIQTGIESAQGEIICLLDSDDYFHPQKVEKVVDAFSNHPDWIQVTHDRIHVDINGDTIGAGPGRYSEGNVQPLLLRWGRFCFGITSSLSYRKKYLDLVLPFPPQKAAAIDTYLNASIPFLGNVGAINEPLMYYRIHGKNIQARNDNWSYLLQERIDTAEFINAAAKKCGLFKQFPIECDVEYRAVTALYERRESLGLGISFGLHSLRESVALRRSLRSTLERFIRHSISGFSSSAGTSIVRLGLKGYLQTFLPNRFRQKLS